MYFVRSVKLFVSYVNLVPTCILKFSNLLEPPSIPSLKTFTVVCICYYYAFGCKCEELIVAIRGVSGGSWLAMHQTLSSKYPSSCMLSLSSRPCIRYILRIPCAPLHSSCSYCHIVLCLVLTFPFFLSGLSCFVFHPANTSSEAAHIGLPTT